MTQHPKDDSENGAVPGEQSEERDNTWNWFLFVLVLIVALLLNIGQGVFQQIEEVLLLPSDARGQTMPVDIGWPFEVLSTYAYSTEIADDEVPLLKRVGYAFADFAITLTFIYAGTKYLSAIAFKCRWRPDILTAIVFLTLFSALLAQGREFFLYQDSVGAFSYALFRCVDAAGIVGAAFAFHWTLSQFGRLITLLVRSGKHS